MKKTGYDLLGHEYEELAIRAAFIVLMYSIVAYRVEIVTKQSFLGRDTSEKAFHRWMKIFETFPEGIAFIRNDYILSGNKALQYIVGINRSNEEDPLYKLLKEDLKATTVKLWVKNPDDEDILPNDRIEKVMTVWQFLINNEKGAIF